MSTDQWKALLKDWGALSVNTTLALNAYGVAPGAQNIPCRVTDSLIVDHAQDHIRDAIRAAIAAGCHMVNISLGALRPYRSLAAALC